MKISVAMQMPKQIDRNSFFVKNKSTELGSDNFTIKYGSRIDTGMNKIVEPKVQMVNLQGEQGLIEKVEQHRVMQNNYGTNQLIDKHSIVESL